MIFFCGFTTCSFAVDGFFVGVDFGENWFSVGHFFASLLEGYTMKKCALAFAIKLSISSPPSLELTFTHSTIRPLTSTHTATPRTCSEMQQFATKKKETCV